MSDSPPPPARARLLSLAANVAVGLVDMLERCTSQPFIQAASYCAAALADFGPPAQLPIAGDDPVGTDPIDRLSGSLGLTGYDLKLLLLAGLADEHDGFAGTFELVHPLREPWPTAGLLAQIEAPGAPGDPALTRALVEGQLVRSGLLEVVGDAPLFRRSLRLAPGLWAALQGYDTWPDGIRRLVRDPVTAGLTEWLDEPEVQLARRAISAKTGCTIAVLSDSEDIAVNRAGAMIRATGTLRSIAVLERDGPGSGDDVLSGFLVARDAIPVIRVPHRDEPGPRQQPILSSHPGPVVICGRPGDFALPDNRQLLTLSTHMPSAAARTEMWRCVLPQLRDAAETLAGHHALEPDLAMHVASDVMLRSDSVAPLS